jgi:hypothetical protein
MLYCGHISARGDYHTAVLFDIRISWPKEIMLDMSGLELHTKITEVVNIPKMHTAA